MNRPIVFIAIAFVLGIVFSEYIALPIWFSLFVLSIFLLLALITIIHKLNPSYILLMICFLLGVFDLQIKNLPDRHDVSNYAGKGYFTVIGQVDDEPKVRDGRISFPLKVAEICRARQTSRAGGLIYVAVTAGKLPSYGDRLKVRGMISESDNYDNPLMPEMRKRCFLNAYSYELLPGGGGNILKRTALWLGRQFNGVLIKILPNKEASLLGSVLLGSSVSPLDDEVKDNYRKAGLIHLLVVSGTQVSILIGVCLAIVRGAGLPLWLAIAATSFLNILLVVVTGAGASILRAAIMGEITLIGLLFEREKEFYTALALSALCLIVVDPSTLFDIGFQLSFAATWALVYIAPVLGKKMPQLLALSLAPLLATAPIIAYYFSQISVGGIISNLLVLPWVEFLVILGFATMILGFIVLPLAQIFGNVIWLMLIVLQNIADLIAALPGACFYIKAPSLAVIIGYYAAVVIMIELLRRELPWKISWRQAAYIILFCLSIFIWDRSLSAASFGQNELTVTFLDVGQGDSALIETPEGRKLLIDGGGVERKAKSRDPVGEKVVVPFLHRKGIDHLDLVILTHPHEDHLGGLNSVLEKIKVDQVIDNGQVYDSQAYRRFKQLVALNKIKYAAARAGQIIDFGRDLKGYILNPIFPLLGDTNSDSVVMRLVHGEISFLFAGDMEKAGETRVLQRVGRNLRSTALKVGHHGSSTSTSAEFLSAVSPKIAIISCGLRNKFRHPHRATLERLKLVTTYRTDKNGAIVVKSDGQRIRVEPTLPVAGRK